MGCLCCFALHVYPTYPCPPAAATAPPGIGPYGEDATCVQVAEQGGLSFGCRQCDQPGYQPFANASFISFWLQSDASTDDATQTSTPQGQVHTYCSVLITTRDLVWTSYCIA